MTNTKNKLIEPQSNTKDAIEWKSMLICPYRPEVVNCSAGEPLGYGQMIIPDVFLDNKSKKYFA